MSSALPDAVYQADRKGDPRFEDLNEWSDAELVRSLLDASWLEVASEVYRRLNEREPAPTDEEDDGE